MNTPPSNALIPYAATYSAMGKIGTPDVTTQKVGQPGDLYLKGGNVNYGTAPLEFIPLARSKGRVRFRPRIEGGGVLCRSFDGALGTGDPGGQCASCEFSVWTPNPVTGKKAIPPGCDETENLYILIRKDPAMPVLLVGVRTRLKAFRVLNTFLLQELIQYGMLYNHVFELTARPITTQNLVSHVFEFRRGGETTEAERKQAGFWYQAIKDRPVSYAEGE